MVIYTRGIQILDVIAWSWRLIWFWLSSVFCFRKWIMYDYVALRCFWQYGFFARKIGVYAVYMHKFQLEARPTILCAISGLIVAGRSASPFVTESLYSCVFWVSRPPNAWYLSITWYPTYLEKTTVKDETVDFIEPLSFVDHLKCASALSSDEIM